MIELKDNTQQEYTLKNQMSIFKEKTKKDFISFYDTYLPKLIFYNNKIVRDVLIAEDIATDSILKSLKKIDDYNPEKAGYSTWLFTISRNECIQYLNKNKKLTSIDKYIDEEGTTIKDFLKDDSDELVVFDDLDKLNIKKGNILKDKIKYLKAPYREVIGLREIDGKSYRDITIILKEEDNIHISGSFFGVHYNKGILTLVDPEKKNENELVKFCSINNIKDINGNLVNFKVVEVDNNNLISKIELPKGEYRINGEVPFNMSTLKSQIRNGRIMLKNMVRSEFEKLDKIHL
jgi:RNA polymerase sigma factor (sigma-70 family)